MNTNTIHTGMPTGSAFNRGGAKENKKQTQFDTTTAKAGNIGGALGRSSFTTSPEKKSPPTVITNPTFPSSNATPPIRTGQTFQREEKREPTASYAQSRIFGSEASYQPPLITTPNLTPPLKTGKIFDRDQHKEPTLNNRQSPIFRRETSYTPAPSNQFTPPIHTGPIFERKEYHEPSLFSYPRPTTFVTSVTHNPTPRTTPIIIRQEGNPSQERVDNTVAGIALSILGLGCLTFGACMATEYAFAASIPFISAGSLLLVIGFIMLSTFERRHCL